MSNHARRPKPKARKPVDRYDAAELHALAVQDYGSGVHTGNRGQVALAWFAEACARISRLRGISKDQAFLEIVHDAEQAAGRPLL